MTDAPELDATLPASGARVLVVEDSATQAAALALLLERAGYATVLARRAERALELLEHEHIDLVLSDVVMPVMDGYELCRRIKAQPAWRDIPVVLLTSVTDPLAIVRGLASGADHYVTKPYDSEGLLARVRFVMHRAANPQHIVSAPFDIELLGTKFSIRATKEQILELLVSSYSDLVRTSEVVRDAEKRGRVLYEEAQRATRARDDVLAIVSHDLRNPINTIHMSTSFLLDALAEPGGKEVPVIAQLKVMKRATHRANALIGDLLDVSRIDAGTLAVATTAIDASMLLQDAALELEPLVTGSKLVFEHAWNGPDVLVMADRSRIGQVFSNLVGNAIKFTKAGGTVTITGSRRDDMADFDVIDTGAGIPPEQLPHLFDRFWQANNTTRSGAGLGLYIVKGIVEAHLGTIAVETVAGQGTRFRVSLPAAVKK